MNALLNFLMLYPYRTRHMQRIGNVNVAAIDDGKKLTPNSDSLPSTCHPPYARKCM